MRLATGNNRSETMNMAEQERARFEKAAEYSGWTMKHTMPFYMRLDRTIAYQPSHEL